MEEIRVKDIPSSGSSSTIQDKWTKYVGLKNQILARARKCAELTIPALLPPEGHTEQNQLLTPYQSLGARCVNNLSAKMLLALFPPNTPIFRCEIDDIVLEKLSADASGKTKIDKALGKVERSVMKYMEMSKTRVGVFEGLRQYVTTGNVMLYLPDEGGIKCYKIDQYCCKRDPMGNVLEIIIKESVHPIVLPDSVRDKVMKDKKDATQKVDVYTFVERGEKEWTVTQEVGKFPITETGGTYALDDSPFIPLRMSAIASEDYGRGIVDEYLGDFISLEGLMESMVLGSAAAAKILFLVNPNGVTSVVDLRKIANGGFATGKADDVTVLHVDKYNDFKMVAELIDRLERRLSYAFLLNSSVQRQAERVTAEEIRMVAGELEDTLGGVYSILSQELQLPLIKRLMKQMTKQKKLPALPKEVKPVITTGLEALGRGHDLNKLMVFGNTLKAALGESTVATYMKPDNYIDRVGTSLGIDTDGLIASEEEVMAKQQQAMIASTVSSSAPGVAREVAKGAVTNATQEEE